MRRDREKGKSQVGNNIAIKGGAGAEEQQAAVVVVSGTWRRVRSSPSIAVTAMDRLFGLGTERNGMCECVRRQVASDFYLC